MRLCNGSGRIEYICGGSEGHGAGSMACYGCDNCKREEPA